MTKFYLHIVLFYLPCGGFLWLITGCTHGQLYNNDLEQELYTLEAGEPFSLDSLLTDAVDVLYIAKPYQYKELEKHRLRIPGKLRKKFEKITLYDEDKSILLLVKGDKLVGYTIVNNQLTDFSQLDKQHEGIPVNSILVLDSLRRITYHGND